MAEKKVVVSFNHAPYGSIFYTEGLRATVGVTAGIDEHKADAVFLGDGVYFTLKGVDRTDTAKYLGTLAALGSKLYVEEESLVSRGFSAGDVADDIAVISRREVLQLYSEADVNIDF